MFRKAFKYYLIGLMFLFVVGIALFEFACRAVSERHFPGFSTTKKGSINEGFYVASYRPININYPILLKADTISFDTAWLEHKWKVEERLGLCLLEHKVKTSNFHFTIPLTTTASKDSGYGFNMKPVSKSSSFLYKEGDFFQNSFVFDLPAPQDTIKVIITNRTNDTAKSSAFSDTLLFVRLLGGK